MGMSELVVDLPSQIVIPLYELEIIGLTFIGTYLFVSAFTWRYIAVRDGVGDVAYEATDWKDISLVDRLLMLGWAMFIGLPLVVESQREAHKRVEELLEELEQ